MKQLFFLIGIFVIGSYTNIYSQVSFNKKNSKKLFRCQKEYYVKELNKKTDFLSIVNFGKKKRFEILDSIKKETQNQKELLIFECYAPNEGIIKGLIFSDSTCHYYGYNNIQRIENATHDLKNISQITGIEEHILKMALTWDTISIKKINNTIGLRVNDGFFCMVSKFTVNKHKRTAILTFGFMEFKKPNDE